MPTVQEQKINPDISPPEVRSDYLLLLFGTDPKDVQVKQLWYRGDAKSPDEIFKKGFIARGTNLDVLSHVNPIGEQWFYDSAYVATSTSKNIAKQFPKDSLQAFLYEINAQRHGVDVSSSIHQAMNEKRMNTEDAKIYLQEKEMAVPHKIKPSDIKGAWQVEVKLNEEFNCMESELFIRSLKDEYIPNPRYANAIAARILNTAKVTGHGLTGIGAILDGMSLFDSYELSKKMNDFDPFFQEGARILGGWSGAWALGTKFAARGGMIGGRTFGPIGAAVGTVGTGIIGGVLGYQGGGTLAAKSYKHAKIKDAKAVESKEGVQYMRSSDQSYMFKMKANMNEAKMCPMPTEAMRVNQPLAVINKDEKSCPADEPQTSLLDSNYFDELYKKMGKNQAATVHELEQVKHLLFAYGVNQIEFNQEVLRELAPITSYINQQMEHTKRVQALEENLAILRGVHDAFGVIGHIAKRNGEMEIMKAAVFGQHTVGMVTNIGKITGSFGFLAVKGPAMLEPTSALIMAGFSLYDLLSSDDEEENNQGRAIQEQIQKFCEYVGLRFDRMEDLLTSGFTHLSKQIKNVYESIMIAVHYAHLDMDIKIQEIKTELNALSSDTVNFNLAHFTQALNEIEDLAQEEEKFVGTELNATLKKLKSYLLTTARSWPFTFTPSAAVERKPTEIAFNSENVQNRLGNKDLFNRLGYLYEYRNHLLGKNVKKGTMVANPYIWLRSMYSYLRLIRQNSASNDFPQLLQLMKDSLMKPAKTDMKFFQDVRSAEFIQKLFSNLETRYKNVIDYVRKAFEQKKLNTNVLMDEKLKEYEDALPKNRDFGGDLTPMLQDMQSKGCKASPEFYYAEAQGWGDVRIIIPNIQSRLPIPFALSYVDNNGKPHDTLANWEKRIQIFSIKSTFQARPRGLAEDTQIRAIFPYMSVYINTKPTSLTCEVLQFEDYRKQLRARIEDELVLQPRKELARNLIDHTHPEGKKYNELIDLLNTDYLTLQAFLSISGLDLKSSEAKTTLAIGNENLSLENPFYSNMPAKAALQAVANHGQLTSLNFFFEDKLSLNFVAYQNALITQAKAAAENKNFISSNAIELQLKNAINLFKNIKELIHASQKFSEKQQAVPKTPLPKKDAPHKKEPMTPSIESSEEKSCDLQQIVKLATEEEKSQLDAALRCSDHRARNMLVIQLVKAGVYHSDDPQEVIRIVKGYLDYYKDNSLQKNYENLLMLSSNHQGQTKTKKAEKEHQPQTNSASRASVAWFSPISTLASWAMASSNALGVNNVLTGLWSSVSNVVGYTAGNNPPLKEPSHPVETKMAAKPSLSVLTYAQLSVPVVNKLCKTHGLFGHKPLDSHVAFRQEGQYTQQLQMIADSIAILRQHPILCQRIEYFNAQKLFEKAKNIFKNVFRDAVDPAHEVTQSESVEVIRSITMAIDAINIPEALYKKLYYDNKLNKKLIELHAENDKAVQSLCELEKRDKESIANLKNQQQSIGKKWDLNLTLEVENALEKKWNQLNKEIITLQKEQEMKEPTRMALRYLLNKIDKCFKEGDLFKEVFFIKNIVLLVKNGLNELTKSQDFSKNSVLVHILNVANKLMSSEDVLKSGEPAHQSIGFFALKDNKSNIIIANTNSESVALNNVPTDRLIAN